MYDVKQDNTLVVEACSYAEAVAFAIIIHDEEKCTSIIGPDGDVQWHMHSKYVEAFFTRPREEVQWSLLSSVENGI